MISACIACGEPLDPARRIDAQTCDAVCRNRVFRARQARLSRLVLEQMDAINHADFARLERLLLEAAALDDVY